MSNKKISYLNRNFDDYRNAFMDMVKKYYPDIANDFNDASIGSWMVDLISAASDNLSYHIDKVFNETSIDSAQEKSSLYSLARSNGFKVPAPKGSMVEVVFTCEVTPSEVGDSNLYGYLNNDKLPIIKRGTKVSNGRYIFETVEDINFKEQYNNNGVSDRTVMQRLNQNGDVVKYKISKKAVVIAGESKIYKQVVNQRNIKPFMEILIPDNNIMEIESVITKEGANFNIVPNNCDFFMTDEVSSDGKTARFFEVNSLLEQYRWGDNENVTKLTKDESGYNIVNGIWKPLSRKFITEYTDRGFVKVIFGSGIETQDSEYTDFTQEQMYRMVNNKYMGLLPKEGTTLFIRYRSGGGSASNVAANTLTNIVSLICDIKGDTNNAIRNSITVTNPLPSISGKDIPTVEELRNMIKYNSSAQERCVTLKDYENRVLKMPSRYGCPFRVAATEENNKVMLYLMNIGEDGKLTNVIPQKLIDNIINYLSMYRSLNDYVEIKSGRIINISIEADIFVDKNYDSEGVIANVIKVISDYMDINKRYLGEDIFVGDIQKEISMVDGVLNLTNIRIYNEIGDGYSSTTTTQETFINKDYGNVNDVLVDNSRLQIDLDASDYVLISDADCMFEIKDLERDIKIQAKER